MSKTDSFGWMRRGDKWYLSKFGEFNATIEKSKKECADLFKMNELILVLAFTFIAVQKIPSFFDEDGMVSDKYSQSLLFTCFVELIRGSACTVFLCGCGLYKNAYHNIRYALESAVQSACIDQRHPNADFSTKMEILKEVEDLPDYRGSRLVQKLEIENKDEIQREYKKLSAKIHSTHIQFMATMSDVMMDKYHSTSVDCGEVSNIYNSMRMLYDIFFLLFLSYFPEAKKPLLENKELLEIIKDHNLNLLSRIQKV